eukprot:663408-Hanusia_phi.AAC.1
MDSFFPQGQGDPSSMGISFAKGCGSLVGMPIGSREDRDAFPRALGARGLLSDPDSQDDGRFAF